MKLTKEPVTRFAYATRTPEPLGSLAWCQAGLEMHDATLETLSPLLRFLRSFDILEETPGAKFLLKGRDFIHFHDDPDGLWADVKLTKGRIRLSVATPSEQGELMERISNRLDSLNNRGQRRSGRRRGST